MLKRLRIKFVCIMMVIVTVMLAVVFGLVLSFTQRGLEQDSIQMMHAVSARQIHMERPGGRPAERPQELPGEVRLPFFVLEIGDQGEILSAHGGYYDLSDRAFLEEIAAAALSAEEQVGVLSQYDLRYCRVTDRVREQLVFSDISSERATIRDLARNCALIGLLALTAFFFLSLLLARWAVKPVETAWKEQRKFVADASHELKTPLTVIMTNAELLENTDFGPEERRRFSASILTMSRQMRQLVERLLELARVDSAEEVKVLAPTDFSQVVSDAILPFEPLYFEKGLELRWEIEEGVVLRGDADRLRQLPEILLDNAMKYADPQTAVAVRLRRQGGHALLAVANQGPPIPAEELRAIFKRFYRGDKARSRTGSYGLGLAIAESIVHAHRGKIWAESGEGVNTFFIQFPL